LNDGTPSQTEGTGNQPRHRQMVRPVGIALLPKERAQLLVDFYLNHRSRNLVYQTTFILAQTTNPSATESSKVLF
jgi:hypothetical protein